MSHLSPPIPPDASLDDVVVVCREEKGRKKTNITIQGLITFFYTTSYNLSTNKYTNNPLKDLLALYDENQILLSHSTYEEIS
mmetsp:Transcript_15709/g.43483  ORF Transcript_15709/g.43483 Transcript_15709/m.43483 type:complete len:82 (+) Transcript_15709:480-725(+)